MFQLSDTILKKYLGRNWIKKPPEPHRVPGAFEKEIQPVKRRIFFF